MSEINRYWHGRLTQENIEDVVNVMREMLTGRKYTFASMLSHESMLSPYLEVKTNQELKPDDPFGIYHAGKFSGFSVNDSYSVWGANTVDAHIAFDYHQITIEHKSAGGNDITWVIALEK